MPAQIHTDAADRRDAYARIEERAGADTKVGPGEGFLLAVMGLIGGIIVVGGLVLSVVSIAVGDGQLSMFTHSE